MPEAPFEERVLRIFRRDPRYNPDAYYFVSQALSFTQDQLGGRSASGQYLLEGLRQYALQTFGPTALRTLKEWGLHCCEDFGAIVFNLVEEGMIAPDERDRREDFRGGYAFAEAFPEPKLSKKFFVIMCHLFFDDEELAELEKRFREDGSVDGQWLAGVRIDPFISNSPPTGQQMSDFHTLLEDKGQAVIDARFDDAIVAFEAFASKACRWECKPDMMMHDVLVELEPYCPEFVKAVLAKLHLTPDAESDPGSGVQPVILSGRDITTPRGFQTVIEEGDLEEPERDLTGFSGFGHAPPVSHEVHVYINKVMVDRFEISRDVSEKLFKKTVLERPRVVASLRSKGIQRVLIVQKHLHVNACIDGSPI